MAWFVFSITLISNPHCFRFEHAYLTHAHSSLVWRHPTHHAQLGYTARTIPPPRVPVFADKRQKKNLDSLCTAEIRGGGHSPPEENVFSSPFCLAPETLSTWRSPPHPILRRSWFRPPDHRLHGRLSSDGPTDSQHSFQVLFIYSCVLYKACYIRTLSKLATRLWNRKAISDVLISDISVQIIIFFSGC